MNRPNHLLVGKDQRLKEALDTMKRGMEVVEPATYSFILHESAKMGDLQMGYYVHTHMIKTGLKQYVSLWNHLVNLYVKCNSLMNARQVFDKISQRNVVTWTAMITGCVRNGCGREALNLFHQMQFEGIKPDHFTFSSVAKTCGMLADLEEGKRVHELVIVSGFQSNVVVGSALLDMYVKCGSLENARQIFDKMSERNLVSWNALVAGYAKSGLLDEASRLFCQMPEVDLVSWSAIIAGYAQNGNGEVALKLFFQLQSFGLKVDEFILTSVLEACAGLADWKHGKEVHAHIIRIGLDADVVVSNAMIDMYAKCACMKDAHQVFDKMTSRDLVSWNVIIAGYAQNESFDRALKLLGQIPQPDIVSWNAIIAGYAQHGQGFEAWKLFHRIRHGEIEPDQFTFASALGACSSLGTLDHGKQVHALVHRTAFGFNVVVGNALVGMYAKCGSIDDAQKVFDTIYERNVISWTTMIVGCAQHGQGKEALELFDQMLQAGIKPNEITLVGVLTACSHAGLVDKGYYYFNSMNREHGITPRLNHYTCMVDLIARAGFLDMAEEFINKLPIEPDAAIWGALLGAGRIHGNIEQVMHAAECLLEFKLQDAGTYVLLSNIYAASGRWDDVARVRKLMKDRGVKKQPGCSWIEIKNMMHSFVVGDS